MKERKFFRVIPHTWYLKLPDPQMNGYENETLFRQAVDKLVNLWGKRTGEAISERNGFYYIRFHDTPGGRFDEAWLPKYILEPVPAPEYVATIEENVVDDVTQQMNEAYGFD